MVKPGDGRQSKRRRERRSHQQQQQLLLKRERRESERHKKLKGKRYDFTDKSCRHQLGGAQASSSSSSAAAASKFMSVVADDVLQEIFLRLPDSRSVIACGAVCKRWFSLVSSQSQRGLYFLRKFNYHHRLKRHQQDQEEGEQLPYTLLLRGIYIAFGGGPSECYWPTMPCHDVLSDESKILHYGKGKVNVDYLDFFPWPRGCIASSLEDLLLIRVTYHNFCICNPLTRQWILLPNNPVDLSLQPILAYRCGLVCKSDCTCHSQFGFGQDYYCNCSIKYRVALISARQHGLRSSVFNLSIFSSETGRWTQSTLRFEINLYYWCETPIVHNGVLYWALEDDNHVFHGVVAIDPFKFDSKAGAEEEQQCRLISLPLDFARGNTAYRKSNKARLGVVRGCLRLAQFYFSKRSDSYILKVWQLDDDHHNNLASWDLVHHVRIQRLNKRVELVLVALHPEDGDVFLLTSVLPHERLRGKFDLFQYRIGSSTSDDGVELVFRCRNVSRVFPLVHPWWPTTIPSLPSFN